MADVPNVAEVGRGVVVDEDSASAEYGTLLKAASMILVYIAK